MDLQFIDFVMVHLLENLYFMVIVRIKMCLFEINRKTRDLLQISFVYFLRFILQMLDFNQIHNYPPHFFEFN